MVAGCTNAKSSTSESENKWGQYMVDEKGNKITPTASPTRTPKQMAYDDKNLAQTIITKGEEWNKAADEIVPTIRRGELSTASNGMKGIRLDMNEYKYAVKKMKINNQNMADAWLEYIEKYQMHMYRMDKAINSIKSNRNAEASDSIKTASQYRAMADDYYKDAKKIAESVLNQQT